MKKAAAGSSSSEVTPSGDHTEKPQIAAAEPKPSSSKAAEKSPPTKAMIQVKYFLFS
jgi:hypothetical protein